MGSYYYTPISFLTDKLYRPSTLDRAILLGPGIIHTKMNADCYSVFANYIKRQIGDESVLAISTDSDPALYGPFIEVLEPDVHFIDRFHFWKNCKEELSKLNVASSQVLKIEWDIFGYTTGNTYVEGLWDAASVEEMQEKVSFYIWPAAFKAYFLKNKVAVLFNSLRIAARKRKEDFNGVCHTS